MNAAAQTVAGNSSRKFLLGRLHSLMGIVPLGLFLLEHLFSNVTAAFGSAAFNHQVAVLHAIPLLPVLEILLIFLPLVYHAGYGIYLAYISKNNVNKYQYARNWMFALQRLTGIVTLLFVGYHVWMLRVANWLSGTEISYQIVQDHLSTAWIALFYVIGVVSTSFHFTNGLGAGLITWGVTIGKHSQKIAAWLMFILFLILSAIGIGSVVSFWIA
ncbi:succinate dehydrogenase [Ferviditalea candida]|uniref:Succinate dehydrogenase n=1 Tax=Ferviditalea candida TaxID=3108399 RepID=A0ABU5ZPF0_9BACL|nr:succinate dehydrogenase [Paenibacillaceae bacterium T2]